MWVIDRSSLEREIDKKAAQLDVLVRGRKSTSSIEEAVQIAKVAAVHDALVYVFNALQEKKSIWDDPEK